MRYQEVSVKSHRKSSGSRTLHSASSLNVLVARSFRCIGGDLGQYDMQYLAHGIAVKTGSQTILIGTKARCA